MMHRIRTAAVFAAFVVTAATAAVAAPHCYQSYGGTKPNKLYLYFPAVADATYPEFGTTQGAPPTRPSHAFNIADLSSYTGTVGDLRNAVFDVVADDYCEFNVQVFQTTTFPPSTFPRRNTVAIGTDDGSSAGILYGLAQNVDTGDGTAVDFAHEWAKTYQTQFGGPGGALNGANSTLQRWANAIGGTAAHEAGHNYGLSHGDGLLLAAGEDALTRHIMASGDHFNGEQRAGYRRHFSDHEYSVLASNVGLSVQTIWNWDFVNPNQQTASRVQIEFLSTRSLLSVTGPYNGNESPWINPAVSASLGTQVFKGVTYHRFRATWSTGHAWDGHVPSGPGPAPGVSGQVAGGASFHIGTGFTNVDYNTQDPIIITDVALLDASNNALALHPRAMGFDSGNLSSADGSFTVQAFNFGALLQLESVRVQFLPRLLTIDAMVGGNDRLVDVRGLPFAAWDQGKTVRVGKGIERGQTLSVPVAKLSDKRHILETLTAADCARQDRVKGPDTAGCKPGINVDLFPSTTVYLSATVIDPASKYWDYRAQKYVQGALTSHMFLQFAGFHPDLNKNGIDDAIDIASGKYTDKNGDGIPDNSRR